MVKFGLLSAIRDYSLSKGYAFFMGADEYINAIMDKKKYANNEYIVVAMFSAKPIKDNSSSDIIEYTGKIAFGRKCETKTVGAVTTKTTSSLDETFEQKYDRRLLDLMQKVDIMVKELSCINELEVTSFSIDMSINRFDLNADFVDTNITFRT